ncbi:GNAT family N-acetyltransferase [Bordetella genomosp. 12]|uniref:N-acetyltransferase domain-containing protein n=1 Tax=Bordetella genomosp. 12 TaxID=463035 RepID=A0A261VLS8_9BORD|nr:N-acetyltransferase [Bordetella genomosp. 12]OZI75074.1 hypothetical protein CAL22_11735 [Bordetella genomosp. 12]
MTTPQTWRIQALSASDVDTHLPALADVLQACVANGASVNFLLPYSLPDAMAFWRDKVRPGVDSGGLYVLAAWRGDALEGTVQLDLDTPPNQPHRAEVRKLLVHPRARRLGLARALMQEVMAEAARRERRLLTLDTVSDSPAEALYRGLGFDVAGRIPAYAIDPHGLRAESTTLMYRQA